MTPPTARGLVTRLRITFLDNAIEELERAAQARLDSAPGDPVAQAYLARALYKEGRFAEARRLLEQADAEDVEVLAARGDFHDYVGELDEAEAAYRAALERDPQHLDALLGLAAVLLQREDFIPADRLAATAQPMIDEQDACQVARLRVVQGAVAGLRAGRGGLFDKLRWGPGVLHAFEEARRLCPNSAYPRFALGRFYREAPGALGGSWHRAAQEFRAAVALDPNYYMAQHALIAALEASGQDAAKERAAYEKRFAELPAVPRV
jgi:tetratricopeptide (TPR) repeat protein